VVKQELTATEVTAGVRKIFLGFMELTQLLLGGGQFISNEHKN